MYVERVYKEEFPGKTPRGRPPKRRSDQIRQELGIPLLTLERYAPKLCSMEEECGSGICTLDALDECALKAK